MVMIKKTQESFYNLLAQNDRLSSSDIYLCNVVSLFIFLTIQEPASHITVRLWFSIKGNPHPRTFDSLGLRDAAK